MDLRAFKNYKEINQLKTMSHLNLCHHSRVIVCTEEIGLFQTWCNKLKKHLNYYQLIFESNLSHFSKLRLKYRHENLILILDEALLDPPVLEKLTNNMDTSQIIIVQSEQKPLAINAMTIQKDAIDFLNVTKQFNTYSRGVSFI